MKRLCLYLILSFVAPAVAGDPPMPFTGKAAKVTDGDTIHVLLDKETHKIRLLHIDAPESKQAFGTKAKQALSEKIFGKEVKVVWKSRDRYKRILGDICLDDRWIKLELVQDGWRGTTNSIRRTRRWRRPRSRPASQRRACGATRIPSRRGSSARRKSSLTRRRVQTRLRTLFLGNLMYQESL
jgi:endonuclease YncB( thermonuclease family)